MTAASFADSFGTNKFLTLFSLAETASRKTPLVWRSVPSSESSPKKYDFSFGINYCSFYTFSGFLYSFAGKTYYIKTRKAFCGDIYFNFNGNSFKSKMRRRQNFSKH